MLVNRFRVIEMDIAWTRRGYVQLEPGLFTSHNTGSNGPRVQTKTHPQRRCSWSKLYFKFTNQLTQFVDAGLGVASHDYSMVMSGRRNTTGSNIAVSDGFDLNERAYIGR